MSASDTSNQAHARPGRAILLGIALGAALLVGAGGWLAASRPRDVHAELRHRLIESELGSAVYMNFATPAKPPDASSATTPALLAQLRSAIPDRRWEAADALAERDGAHGGDEIIVEALIRAMHDPSGTRRVCVMAKALGRLKDPRAVGALTEAAFDPGNEDLRVCAIQSLGMIGDARAVPKLIDALEQGIMPVEAAKSLARLGDDAAVAPIARAARDPSLRLWMIQSLGELGRTRALAHLVRYANDPSPVREAAGEARWKIAVLSAPQPLQALGDVLARDRDRHRRMWAAFRLGEAGDARSVQPLVNALADNDDLVRGRAAAALVRIGAPALPPVRRAASTLEGSARDYALAVLGYLGDAGDAASLERAATQLRGTSHATALRSTRMIRQFAVYRAQAGHDRESDALAPVLAAPSTFEFQGRNAHVLDYEDYH
jgi:HEAT repeat protein